MKNVHLETPTVLSSKGCIYPSAGERSSGCFGLLCTQPERYVHTFLRAAEDEGETEHIMLAHRGIECVCVSEPAGVVRCGLVCKARLNLGCGD